MKSCLGLKCVVLSEEMWINESRIAEEVMINNLFVYSSFIK